MGSEHGEAALRRKLLGQFVVVQEFDGADVFRRGCEPDSMAIAPSRLGPDAAQG